MTLPTVRVRFYPPLKESLGDSEARVRAADVAGAIAALCEKYGEKFSEEVLNEDGSIKNYYIIMAAGRPVNQKNAASAKLKAGDVIDVFPPVAGG